ncbi:hypothetical protein BO78DRAFT_419590 [Aspergillus sclerotiicarbonarius CBS 121057]|uniref:DUF7791 domain-containing protein n=1 Tax=Aspergillus sclerotiicarbonarius (strain CBS 121057 / IBT 28362) TaxID=1448318 RepID=A0A319EUU5_ASPSB|nr:hypothetical protein BO78DRAFT_419590 [Aspergillus sclerotiicarbonarius CBS 121057]
MADGLNELAAAQVADFLRAGIQFVGQLYELHGLDDEQPLPDWGVTQASAQFASLDRQLSEPFPGREIGPLCEQEQSLEDTRAACGVIARTILSRLNLIQTFGSQFPQRIQTFKQFWPREDVEALEEQLSMFKSELELGFRSSRQLLVFWAAFANNPGLELHDLTCQDMLGYARDHLYEDFLTQVLLVKDSDGASRLIDRLVERADGVFLGVTLVVQSLLRRQDYGDVSKIQEYLLQHPADIDDLFTHLIFEQPAKDQTCLISRLFQLLHAREEACRATGQEEAVTMQLWELALAYQLEEAKIDIPDNVQEATVDDIDQICARTKKRFSNECAGLVITHAPSPSAIRTRARLTPAQLLAESKVSYVHRTVKDYISLPDIWSRLLEISDWIWPLDAFEPHRQIDEWWPSIPIAFTHARLSQDARSQLALIPEFDRVLCQHWAFRDSIEKDHWARSLFSSYEKRKNAVFQRPFLSLAAKFGLDILVRKRIQQDKFDAPEGSIPLLSHCIEFLVSRQKTVYPLSSPELIGSLLANGADPNQTYRDLDKKDRTPWLVVLGKLREAGRRRWIRFYDTAEEGTRRYAAIVSLFLQHGADPDAMLPETRFDPSATALEVVTSVYRKYASPEFGRLRNELIRLGAKEREGHDIFYQVYGN